MFCDSHDRSSMNDLGNSVGDVADASLSAGDNGTVRLSGLIGVVRPESSGVRGCNFGAMLLSDFAQHAFANFSSVSCFIDGLDGISKCTRSKSLM